MQIYLGVLGSSETSLDKVLEIVRKTIKEIG